MVDFFVCFVFNVLWSTRLLLLQGFPSNKFHVRANTAANKLSYLSSRKNPIHRTPACPPALNSPARLLYSYNVGLVWKLRLIGSVCHRPHPLRHVPPGSKICTNGDSPNIHALIQPAPRPYTCARPQFAKLLHIPPCVLC